MKMSAGKGDGLPDRNSIYSALKLFGRTIPISISQDLTIRKHGQSSDSLEAGEGKNFKKPDKIVQCPRCDSYDTKFCYFNNYNVNQPRYFCKNCLRYWTAGGTMRNIPVGAGRRRRKHLTSQLCHVNATQIEGLYSANLLNFGLNLPKSMDLPFEEPSSNGSTITTASNTMDRFSKIEGIFSSQPSDVPSGWDGNLIPAIQWHPPASDGCVVNSKWRRKNGNGSGSAILGKRSREVKLVEEERRTDTSVIIPKTLTVDDLKEASKSPISASLGFKPYSEGL